jgi:Flp pilus assembly protein TadD
MSAGAVVLFLFLGPALFRAPAQDKTRPVAKDSPITEKEAGDFATALSEAAKKGDKAAFLELIDWNAMCDKAAETPNFPDLEKARRNFKEASMAAIKDSGGMLTGIHNEIQQGGSYKALNINVKAKAATVVFRLHLAGDGLNYHRYSLARRRDRVVADDLYIFLSAENLSEGLRRNWLLAAKRALELAGGNKKIKDDPYLAHLEEYKQVNSLFAQKKNGEALKVYRALPEALRKDKNLMVLAMAAARSESPQEHTRMVDEFRKAHPRDAALDLLLIDAYAARKEFDEAIHCLERLNTAVGDDALLSAKRAAFLLEMGKVAEARKAIDAAISGEPDELDGYAIGLDVALAEKNFDDTVTYMTIMEKKFGLQWMNLDETPDFAEFVKSPQYAKWLKTQKKQSKAE